MYREIGYETFTKIGLRALEHEIFLFLYFFLSNKMIFNEFYV